MKVIQKTIKTKQENVKAFYLELKGIFNQTTLHLKLNNSIF